MRGLERFIPIVMVASLGVPALSAAQSPVAVQPDVWRAFAEKMDIGAELTVRLRDGQRFQASLVAIRDDALLLQPKTRVPVPVQAVPYEAILSLERPRDRGMSAGKAAAIGVASGAATFLAVLLVLLATFD